MKKEQSPQFGQRIKEAREALKLKAEELALSLGITIDDLSRLESGEIKPEIDFLVKITGQFDVNPMFLLHGEKPAIIDKRWRFDEWPDPEEFGEHFPAVHEFLWSFLNSTYLVYVTLSIFEGKEILEAEYIKKSLKSIGKTYPGIE